ncbi:MAG: hypothetical protein KGS48_11015, partial [Bacteroidetes bacterium]|nr:hypothetical protein [Bacteroidota bacterium]
MKQRAISAIIFVIAMLGGVFGGATAFYLLFTVILAGSLWELSGLMFNLENKFILFRRVTATLLGSLPFVIFG